MDDAMAWKLTHEARASTAEVFGTLSAHQWAAPSLCGDWTVKIAAAHIVAGAEQTTGSFLKGLVSSGLRFNTFMDRQARAIAQVDTSELIERLAARTTTTNKAPAPVVTMLGEVVTHTEDITRPLGLAHTVDPDALAACLDLYKLANFPVGAKRRVAGLSLVASDLAWHSGEGPTVEGPGLSLLLAITGRRAGLEGLGGDGVATLAARLS